VPRVLAIDVFSYLSYRAFLRDAYKDLKARQRGFSFRWFSKRAGLASPNFLKLVMDGQRNLSTKGAEAFATALGLGVQEASYFRELVDFEQATTAVDKNRAWDRLSAYQGHRKVHAVERHQFEYLSRWWYPAIREMVALPRFREDAEWIARRLRPAITPSQVRSAIDLLLRLSLVVRGEDGRLVQREPLLSTGAEVRSLAIGNFHRQMMERAAEAIDLVDRADREISGLTVALSRDSFLLFKEKIHGLRRELLELSGRETHADRVIQVNFQVFPLAVVESKGEPESPGATTPRSLCHEK
jgi:uncharacterized protein (TIGR02147 family)